mgnify:CR=1 FL=1
MDNSIVQNVLLSDDQPSFRKKKHVASPLVNQQLHVPLQTGSTLILLQGSVPDQPVPVETARRAAGALEDF